MSAIQRLVRISAASVIAALSTVGLSVLATGCGGDGSSAGGTAPGTAPARQAADGDGSPGPAPCPNLKLTGKRNSYGMLYVSCIDQPITVWAKDVDHYDWHQRPDLVNGPNHSGPGEAIPPGSFFLQRTSCFPWARNVGWQMGVTLADGSKASVRVQISQCNGQNSWRDTWFSTINGPTSVVLTTNTGKRVKLVAKLNQDVPGIERPFKPDPDKATYYPYNPIFIESAPREGGVP